ncbi:hypothetical protein GGI26_006481, partial [Coemansia sp. RSA 1358]
GSPVTVSVSITNEGPYPQKEVVMLFTKQDYRFNLAPENNRLRKFTKTEIGVGETKQIEFKLAMEDLAYWSAELKHGMQMDAQVMLQINPYTQQDVFTNITLSTGY